MKSGAAALGVLGAAALVALASSGRPPGGGGGGGDAGAGGQVTDKFHLYNFDVVVRHGAEATFNIKVVNEGNAPGSHNLRFWDSAGVLNQIVPLTLEAGAEYKWQYVCWITTAMQPVYDIYAKGDWTGDNHSEKSVRLL